MEQQYLELYVHICDCFDEFRHRIRIHTMTKRFFEGIGRPIKYGLFSRCGSALRSHPLLLRSQ
jgi:hypothetical protein